MEFSGLSFGDILTVKQSVGTKAFNSAFHHKESKERIPFSTDTLQSLKKQRQKPEKRQDKNMPQELTSKKAGSSDR